MTDTKVELRANISRLLSRPTKPDVLLGHHPLVTFSRQRQSIAVWHGHRIEDHLAEWINKAPGWNAKVRETVPIGKDVYEIDNIAWNTALGVVLAVEAKRVWDNQDGGSQRDVRHKLATYNAAQKQIISHVGIAGGGFRFFVFDVYGTCAKGDNGLSIIAGDKIENVFSDVLWNYIDWERQVMKNALLEALNSVSNEIDAEEKLKTKVLTGQTHYPKDRDAIFAYIDAHA
jgi:hypothetical protein